MTWRPQIGDPSIMGWITVAFYFSTALISAFCAVHNKNDRTGFRFWGLIALFLLLLGINKQLDLQSFFTEVGRIIAREEGWYGKRRTVQFVFVIFVFCIGLTAVVTVWWLLRNDWSRFILPLTGFLLLITFIVIRAASFHHVDLFLKWNPAGVRMNWFFELGGTGIVFGGALADMIGRGSHRKGAKGAK